MPGSRADGTKGAWGEPWKADCNWLKIAGVHFSLANEECATPEDGLPGVTRRIAACVNFFDGVETGQIEQMAGPEAAKKAGRQ